MRTALSYTEKVVAIILFIAAILVFYCTWRNWRLSGYLEDALNYHNSSEFKLARDSINAALSIRPKDYALLSFKGETLASQRHFDAAEKVLREAHGLMPSDSNVSVALASVLAAQGRFDEAETLISGVGTVDARIVAAGIDLKKGNVIRASEAISSIRLSLSESSFNGIAAYYLVEGLLALRERRYEDALKNAERLISYLPKGKGLRPCRGHYDWLLRQGQQLMRVASVEWLSVVGEERLSSVVERVTSLIDRRAKERYGIAAKYWYYMDGDFLLYLAAARALFRNRRYDDAVEYYTKAVGRLKRYMKKYPAFVAISHLNAGYIRRLQAEGAETLRKKKSYLNRAAEEYMKVLPLKGIPVELKYEAALLCGLCYFRAGSHRLAAQYFERAFSYDVRPYIAALNLAVCYDRMANSASAVRWYRVALRYDEVPHRATIKRRIERLKAEERK